MFVSVRSTISEHPRRMRVSFTEYLFMHCMQSVNNVCVRYEKSRNTSNLNIYIYIIDTYLSVGLGSLPSQRHERKSVSISSLKPQAYDDRGAASTMVKYKGSTSSTTWSTTALAAAWPEHPPPTTILTTRRRKKREQQQQQQPAILWHPDWFQVCGTNVHTSMFSP